MALRDLYPFPRELTLGQYLNPSTSASCCMCNAPRNAPRSPTPAQTISPAASDDELLSSDEFANFPEATDRLAAQPAVPRQPPQIMRVDAAVSESESESTPSDSIPTPVANHKDDSALTKPEGVTAETKPAVKKEEESEKRSAVRAIPMKLRPIVPAAKANIQIKNMKKDAPSAGMVKTKPVKIQVKSASAVGKEDLFAELNMGAQ